MRILACDPGYDRLGIAVVDRDAGKDTLIYSTCVTSDKTLSFHDRLHHIGDAFAALIAQYAPHHIALETLFFNKNQKTALMVAEVRGVLAYLARTHDIPLCQYSPQQIKIAVTGYGGSDKRQVMGMLGRLIAGVPADALDDEYDAIAVGLTALASIR